VKVTPLDIQHKQFRKTLQGYAREEVDSFLDDIIETLEELIEERTKLEARLGEMQDKLAHFKAMEESLQSTLVLAQRTADEVKAAAHKEVDLIKQRARIDLENELADVQARIGEAKRELQRHHEHVAQVKLDLRAFLARHAAQIDQLAPAAPELAPERGARDLEALPLEEEMPLAGETAYLIEPTT